MKKIWAGLLTVCLAAGLLGGCRKTEEGAAGTEAKVTETPAAEKEGADPKFLPPVTMPDGLAAEPGTRVAVAVKSTAGEFWEGVRRGMEDAVKYLNQQYGFSGKDKITMTFEGPEDEANLNDLINTVDAVLSENPSVLCLAAGDEDAGEAQLETALENGIPVVLFDSAVQVEEELYVSYCGTDNGGIGRTAAGELARAMGGFGEAAVISHGNNDQTSRRRTDGFLEELEANHPQVEVVGDVTLGGEESLEEGLAALLLENPGLKGIFCTNMDTAEETLGLLKKAKREDLLLVGVDGSSGQIEAIRSGREVGTVAQNPYALGFQTLWTAVCAAAPENEGRLEEKYLIPTRWLDAGNLEEEESEAYLY